MDLDKLPAVAAQLGLSENRLCRGTNEAAEREAAKEAAERPQLADERQLQILQLNFKLQESAQGEPPVATTLVTSPSTSCLNTQKLLPLFDEPRDDLHAYLKRFKRVATRQDWPQDAAQ